MVQKMGGAYGASRYGQAMMLSVAVLLALSLDLVSTMNIIGSHLDTLSSLQLNSQASTLGSNDNNNAINLTSDAKSGSVLNVHTPSITTHRLDNDRRVTQAKTVPSWNYAKHGADWTAGLCKIGTMQSPVDLHGDGLVTHRPKNIKEAFESVLKGEDVSNSINNLWKRGDMVYTYRHLISSVQVLRTDKIFRLSVPANEGSAFGALFTTDKPNLYMATHIEFHSPSEHTFNGSANRRQVEVQIWHYYGDEADSGIGAIEKNETTDMNIIVSNADTITSIKASSRDSKGMEGSSHKPQEKQDGVNKKNDNIDAEGTVQGGSQTATKKNSGNTASDKDSKDTQGQHDKGSAGSGHNGIMENGKDDKVISNSSAKPEVRAAATKSGDSSGNGQDKDGSDNAGTDSSPIVSEHEKPADEIVSLEGKKMTAENLLGCTSDEQQRESGSADENENPNKRSSLAEKTGPKKSTCKHERDHDHDHDHDHESGDRHNLAKHKNDKTKGDQAKKTKEAPKEHNRKHNSPSSTPASSSDHDEDEHNEEHEEEEDEDHEHEDEEDSKGHDDDESFMELYRDAQTGAKKNEAYRAAGKGQHMEDRTRGKHGGSKLDNKTHHQPLKAEEARILNEMVEAEEFELLNKYLLDHLHNATYDQQRDRVHIMEKKKARRGNSHWGRWAVLSLTFMSEEMEKTKIEILKSFPSERFMEQVLKVGSQVEITEEGDHLSVGELNSGGDSTLALVDLDTPINLSSLLMMIETKDLNYFAYDGSFTRPGCEETVRWYVAKEPLPVSTELMLKIHRMLNQTKNHQVTSEPINKYRELQNVNENRHNAGKVHMVHGYPMEYFIATTFNRPRVPIPEPSSMLRTSIACVYVILAIFAIL